jgi:SAM-dependent methyltransferase
VTATRKDESGKSALTVNTRTVLPNPEGDWDEYFAAIATKPLHPLYGQLDRLLGDPGSACELGCGVGQGVLHLAELGWRVLAVDAMDEPLEILRSRLPTDSAEQVSIQQAFIEDLDMPPQSFDLVVAGFSLFFVSREELPGVWERIVASIRPGGLFMGQILGRNDSWATEAYTAMGQEEGKRLFEGFEVLHWDHVERDGKAVHGYPKHWDVTHVIARKR